jgi:hypothetical protein
MLLLLGGIPCQTIKLVAMRGIPMTQAAALVFFLALSFGEVVRFSAESMFRSQDGRQRPVQVPLLALMPWTSLCLGERMFAVCQFWHVAIVGWVVHMAHGLWHAAVAPDGNVTPIWQPEVAGSMLLVATLSGALLAWDPSSTPLFSPQGWPVPYRTLLAMVLILPVPSGWAALFFEEHGISIIVSCILIGIGSSALSAIWISSWLFVLQRLTWLSKTRAGRLLGVPRTPMEHESVLMFVALLSVTIGSYAYFYDARGTVNPEWVGIFG